GASFHSAPSGALWNDAPLTVGPPHNSLTPLAIMRSCRVGSGSIHPRRQYLGRGADRASRRRTAQADRRLAGRTATPDARGVAYRGNGAESMAPPDAGAQRADRAGGDTT